ncbi:hypothetical protein CE91St38_17750 [Desulfovibrionaceae bacterium]|jgi:hypothetical protein|nr:hypothetical protein CE91St38_17750 [Desulfovibrionaceae bacterium]GKI12319.1 hypothetical protein CE91St39_17730 [Desulfovibrionaceae bacterium]
MFNNPDFKDQYVVLVFSFIFIKAGFYNFVSIFDVYSVIAIIFFGIPGIYFLFLGSHTIVKRIKIRINKKVNSLYVIIFQNILSFLIVVAIVTIGFEIYHKYSIFMNKLFFPGIKYD